MVHSTVPTFSFAESPIWFILSTSLPIGPSSKPYKDSLQPGELLNVSLVTVLHLIIVIKFLIIWECYGFRFGQVNHSTTNTRTHLKEDIRLSRGLLTGLWIELAVLHTSGTDAFAMLHMSLTECQIQLLDTNNHIWLLLDKLQISALSLLFNGWNRFITN